MQNKFNSICINPYGTDKREYRLTSCKSTCTSCENDHSLEKDKLCSVPGKECERVICLHVLGTASTEGSPQASVMLATKLTPVSVNSLMFFFNHCNFLPLIVTSLGTACSIFTVAYYI